MTDEGGQESLSPFHFSYNNPVSYNDPDGKCPVCIPAIIAFIEALTAETVITTGAVALTTTVLVGKTVEDIQNSDISLPSGSGAGTLGVSGGINIEFRVEMQAMRMSRSSAGQGSATDNKNKQGPAPNEGVTKSPHGGKNHDKAINDRVGQLKKEGDNVRNIRKDQAQVDVNGKKVGPNRPDVQYDKYNKKTKKWEHYNVEYDNNKRNSDRHGHVNRQNDKNAKNELNIL